MYEASEIVTIGAAHQLILGVKYFYDYVDSEGLWSYWERLMDIDEVDE